MQPLYTKQGQQTVAPTLLRRAVPNELARPSCACTYPTQDIFVINDDITVEKPIYEYYAELDRRLQGLKQQVRPMSKAEVAAEEGRYLSRGRQIQQQ